MENVKTLETILEESKIINQEKVNEILENILGVLPEVIANGFDKRTHYISRIGFNIDVWEEVISELAKRGFKSEVKYGFFKGLRLIITW